MPRALSHEIEMAAGAVVRGIGDGGMQDDAARARRRGEVHRFDVLLVGPDIADVGEREGDDLPGIGGIGKDLLVAGHRGVEADFPDRVSARTEAGAFEHGAVGEHQDGGGGGLGPGGIVLFRGHGETT